MTPLHGVAPEAVEVGNMQKALARGQEIAICTPVKAPELLATFSTAFGEANELLSKLDLQVNLTEEAIRRRRAVLVLDEMAEIVAAKGHSTAKSPTGTAEIKEAVVDGDTRMGELRNMLAILKALTALWTGHRRKFEMDHGAVKRILERGMFDRNLSVPAPVDNTVVTQHTVDPANDPDF